MSTYTWDLSCLYQGGKDDPQLEADLKALAELVAQMNEKTAAFEDALTKDDATKAAVVAEGYQLDEQLVALLERLGAFLYLSHETDTTDVDINNKIAVMENSLSNMATFSVTLANLVKETPLEVLLTQETLAPYAYRLSRQQKEAQHQLSKELEALFAKLSLSGAEAWCKLHGQLTSTLRVPYRDEECGLQEIRNLAYDPDPQVRKDAFDAELAAYPKIADSIAFALNSIKREVKLMVHKRGFKSVLAESAFDEDMSEATLNGLLGALDAHKDIFWRYLRAKGKLLGYTDGLPFYELFAPLGEVDKTFSPEEAKDYLVSCFGAFHKPIAQLIERAYNEHWVDFFPRDKKSGGAFCYNLPLHKQSRVLHNYDNTFNAMQTLAHELGHAYHGQRIEGHAPLNYDYGMTVAETASTFNETHLVLYSLKQADKNGDSQAKLAILENFLQGAAQTVCDIYSRFLFEREVIERCDSEFLSSAELCKIMERAQETAYGTGLDKTVLHPYMWVPKVHYYSATKSYYNYPYAFGTLLSMGLYTLIQKGTLTVEDYDRFLTLTTVSSVEEVGNAVGINLASQEFWAEAMRGFEPFVAEFETLCEELA